VLGELVNQPAWRGLRVELDLEASPVRADPALLERLLANLLTNAARHNRTGGFVEVRTRVDDGWSVLEVTNSVGPAAQSPNGEPVDRPGIGLTVVDAVVAAHGGELRWSEVGVDAVRAEVRLRTDQARLVT
jgi:signal transduction histidine kinase